MCFFFLFFILSSRFILCFCNFSLCFCKLCVFSDPVDDIVDLLPLSLSLSFRFFPRCRVFNLGLRREWKWFVVPFYTRFHAGFQMSPQPTTPDRTPISSRLLFLSFFHHHFVVFVCLYFSFFPYVRGRPWLLVDSSLEETMSCKPVCGIGVVKGHLTN